jgi:hypothetical protein
MSTVRLVMEKDGKPGVIVEDPVRRLRMRLIRQRVFTLQLPALRGEIIILNSPVESSGESSHREKILPLTWSGGKTGGISKKCVF